MIRTIIRRKFLLLVVALGLGIRAFAACGSDVTTAPPSNTPAGQQGIPTELSDLLRSQIDATSLQQLIGGAATP
jgi:hypothetical protein